MCGKKQYLAMQNVKAVIRNIRINAIFNCNYHMENMFCKTKTAAVDTDLYLAFTPYRGCARITRMV